MTEEFSRQLCWSIDIQGYSASNDLEQATVQAELSGLLDQAAAATGLRRQLWERQHSGDGELSLIPADEPESNVIDCFTTELATLLYRRNCEAPAEKRLRVRIAADHGQVKVAPLGYAGAPVIAVSRLVNAAAARHALDKLPGANVGVMLSDRVYKDLVIGGHTSVQASRFLRVSVREKEFAETAWLWVPAMETDALRHAMSDFQDRSVAARMSHGLDAVLLEVRRLQAHRRGACGVDLDHTLDTFRKLVEHVHERTPITAYGEAEHVAFAWVAVESTIIHGHAGPSGGEGEFISSIGTKRDLDLLARVVRGVDTADFEMVRQLAEQVSLSEPQRVQREAGLRNAPAACCFSLLWGLGRLALLLDNPCLVDIELPAAVEPRRNVINVASDPAGACVYVDLATKERTGYHLAAEALYAVNRYVAELEDAWRRSHLIAPALRFELRTPSWIGRGLQVHEVRVDPRPITRLLMGRALYGNRKHVWLRELLQNACDATGMVCRHDDKGYVPQVEVEMEDTHHITIRENGVGMTLQQVLTQLTVLGRSGWRDSPKDEVSYGSTAFFGRFGIGFASVFSVASSVTVLTRTADKPSTGGIAVRFNGPDRPFYTDFTSCAVGTEIRISLTEAMSVAEFREALADLFAYLPPQVRVSPDPQLPTSLGGFSSLARHKQHYGNWAVLQRTGTARLGAHAVRFKLEILHHPAPHKRKNRFSDRPAFGEIGTTGITFCVDGVRVESRQGILPVPLGTDRHQANGENGPDLGLSGCYVTVDFGRDDAPVMASRNTLDLDDELQRELELLVRREVAEAMPQLATAVQAGCLSGRARHDAVYQTLEDILERAQGGGYRQRDSYRGPFHGNPELNEAAARTYRSQCPVQVNSQEGRVDYRLLQDIDAERCSVAFPESLTSNALFSAFVRAVGLTNWLVVSTSRELMLLDAAWPHDEPLQLVNEAAQLLEDFQAIFPEVRQGRVWRLLRADYALSEGTVFESLFNIRLPQRRAVPRDQGLAKRRSEMSMSEQPRVVLNRDHQVVQVIEAYLNRTGEAGIQAMQDWLDRLCKDVLEERSKRSRDVMLPKLRDQLAKITGVQSIRLSTADLQL